MTLQVMEWSRSSDSANVTESRVPRFSHFPLGFPLFSQVLTGPERRQTDDEHFCALMQLERDDCEFKFDSIGRCSSPVAIWRQLILRLLKMQELDQTSADS